MSFTMKNEVEEKQEEEEDVTKGVDETLFYTGQQISKLPSVSSYYFNKWFPKLSQIIQYGDESYWSWNIGLKPFLLFFVVFVMFGIAVFLFKLIAFTSILSHKDAVRTDPLVNYLRASSVGFENQTKMSTNLQHDLTNFVQSTYLGGIDFVKRFVDEMNRFKTNVDNDLFQPFLLKNIVPIVDNFRYANMHD